MKIAASTIFLLLILIAPAYPQSDVAAENEGRQSRKVIRREAKNQIVDLKDGYLLIRLQTRSKSLKTIRDKGYQENADKLETAQKEINKAIAIAFNANIKFCNVAFFYSDDSKKLLDGDFDQIAFMDEQLNPVPNPIGSNTFYLILDLNKLKDNRNRPDNDYSASLNIPAFIVKDAQLKQLRKPFPYYVRSYSLQPPVDRILIAAMKLNKRLFRFYKRTVR